MFLFPGCDFLKREEGKEKSTMTLPVYDRFHLKSSNYLKYISPPLLRLSFMESRGVFI